MKFIVFNLLETKPTHTKKIDTAKLFFFKYELDQHEKIPPWNN